MVFLTLTHVQLLFAQPCEMDVKQQAPTAQDSQRLRRYDRAIIHWICSFKPHGKVHIETLYTKLEIQEVAVVLRTKRLS